MSPVLRFCDGCLVFLPAAGQGRPRRWCDDCAKRANRRRVRRQRGPTPIARHSDPDFVPSLRLLIERERYSHGDIGMMFGVSRERVRQWCVRYGIEHPDGQWSRGLAMYRRWNDAENRFEPVRRSAAQREQVENRKKNRRERFAARLARRRAEMVATLRHLRDDLGRDPTVAEMGRAVFGRDLPTTTLYVMLTDRWHGPSRPIDYKAAMREIREATGIAPRPRGAHGHRSECECGKCGRRMVPA